VVPDVVPAVLDVPPAPVPVVAALPEPLETPPPDALPEPPETPPPELCAYTTPTAKDTTPADNTVIHFFIATPLSSISGITPRQMHAATHPHLQRCGALALQPERVRAGGCKACQ
jgi:hypothetical protein